MTVADEIVTSCLSSCASKKTWRCVYYRQILVRKLAEWSCHVLRVFRTLWRSTRPHQYLKNERGMKSNRLLASGLGYQEENSSNYVHKWRVSVCIG